MDRNFSDRNTRGAYFFLGIGSSFSVLNSTITNNGGPGVELDAGTDMLIANNMISGNTAGVLVRDSARGTIAGNAINANGVGVATAGTGLASLSGNLFFANANLGIDLGNDGVTINDPGDGDGRQNFPVLTSATSNSTSVTIAGSLNSTANTTFTVDFFANESPDPSGFGEGQVFLGSATVATKSDGNAAFTATLPGAVPNGHFISATATGPNGSSEFAGNIQVGSTELCVICHKRQVTITLPCDSLEYLRHLDHRDAIGACPD